MTPVDSVPLIDCIVATGAGANDGGDLFRERNDGNILLVSDPTLDFLAILSDADLVCCIPPLLPLVVAMVPETAS